MSQQAKRVVLVSRPVGEPKASRTSGSRIMRRPRPVTDRC